MHDQSNFPPLKPGVTYILRRALGSTDPFEVNQKVPGASAATVESARRLAKARPGHDAVVACYVKQTGHIIVYDVETGASSDVYLTRLTRPGHQPPPTISSAAIKPPKSGSGVLPPPMPRPPAPAPDFSELDKVAFEALRTMLKFKDPQVMKETVKECFDWAEEFMAESERRRTE